MDNLKEQNGINIENIGKINGITKGYWANRNGVSYALAPYDANNTHVYRMMESSGTTVKDYVGGTDGSASSGTTITTGIGINKNARYFDGSHYISLGVKAPIGAKSIRIKFKKTQNPSTHFWTLFDSSDAQGTNYGIIILINTSGKINVQHYRGNSTQHIFNITSNLTLGSEWYDMMLTWDGTTNANGVKLYIKALSGTDAGKWYNSSNVAQSSITYNLTATASYTQTTADTYIGTIGNTASSSYYSNYLTVQDLQISDIARTDMKEYI